MMFFEYLKLGADHILDLNGIDHLLFLVALVIIFSIDQWKQVLILATAFTIGHSITLAAASLGLVAVNASLIEILIAASIAWTAASNFLFKEGSKLNKSRYLTATLFGLIHGLGFSNFFKTILGKESITFPLLAFNLGVEIAQVLIVVATLIISFILTNYLKLKKRYLITGTSSIIIIWSLKMIFERI